MELSIEILNKIAENLETGFSCFLHKETAQLITIPKEIDFLNDDLDNEFSDVFEAWKEDIQDIKTSPESFIKIEDMPSTDAFRIMEDFIRTVADEQLKERLFLSIQLRKPFAHFKSEIQNSGSELRRWFEFRRQYFIIWVRDQINTC